MSGAARSDAASGMGGFVLVWVGQLASIVGSSLTTFVLAVWVYQHTGSATRYGLVAAAASLPGLLLLPLAGAVADRHDRRTIMIVSDVGAALGSLALGLLLVTGRLELWHIYLGTAVISVFNTFQAPAYGALVTLLVSRSNLGRANGLLQAGQALQVMAPGLAGVLLDRVGVAGIVALDLATFLFAWLMLLAVRMPSLPARGPRRDACFGLGWSFLKSRPELLRLLLLSNSVTLLHAMGAVLISPLVLSFATAGQLGAQFFVGGSGLLAGGLLLSLWGGPRRPVRETFRFMLLAAVCLVLHGAWPSLLLISLAGCGFLFTTAIVKGLSAAAVQSRVPAELQGRVSAVSRMLGVGVMSAAYVGTGPLAEYVFEPLLAHGGPLAGTLGAWIGVGPGRGVALIFIVMGLALGAVALASSRDARLRRLDQPAIPEPDDARGAPEAATAFAAGGNP